jgi:hypothetical protein
MYACLVPSCLIAYTSCGQRCSQLVIIILLLSERGGGGILLRMSMSNCRGAGGGGQRNIHCEKSNTVNILGVEFS